MSGLALLASIGFAALSRNTTGVGNTAVWAFTLARDLLPLNTGNLNTATGQAALFNNENGSNNTANGGSSLQFNTSGDNHTAIGVSALLNNTTDNGNTAVGFEAGNNVTTANNVIAIRSLAANLSNTCFIGNIRGVTTGTNDAIPVLIDSAGQLGTISSSRRFQCEIKPMEKASEMILALNPVTFHYKSDRMNRLEFG